MLAQLEIEHLRSHEHTVLDWRKQINYVAGPNGAGKSTLRMALRMLFLDRCDVTTGNGQYKDALIQTGYNDYNVTGVLSSDGSSLIRTKGGGFGFGAASLTELNAAIAQHIAHPVTLGVCLGDPIFELGDEQLKGLLLAMAGVDLKSSALKEYLEKGLDKHFKLLQSDIKALQVADGPEGLATAEKQFYALRAAANKEKKEQASTALGLQKLGPFDFNIEEETAKGEGLRQTAIKLREQANAARKDSGSDDRQRLATVREKVSVLEDEAKKLDPPKDVPGLLSSTIEKRRKISTDFDASIEKKARYMAEIMTLQESSATLLESDGAKECPTCGQEIDEEKVKENYQQAQVRLRDLQNLYQVEGETGANLKAETEKLDKRIRELERLRDIGTEVQRSKGEIENLEQTLGAASDSHSLDVLNSQLDDAERDLRDWENRIGGKLDAAKKKKAADDSLKKWAARHEALDLAHGLVGKFRSEEVGKKVKDFMARINKAAAMFGMQYELDAENMTVTCAGLLYRSLSESERIRVDTVFRAAVAYSTGVRFMVIDRADVLDSAGRGALVQILLASGVRALVLAKIDSRDLFNPNPHEKIDFYWVEKEDGVSRLTQLPG